MKRNNDTDMPEGHRNQLKALPMAKSVTNLSRKINKK